MRMWEFTVFIIMVEIALGVTQGLLLFETQYYTQPQINNGGVNQSTDYITGKFTVGSTDTNTLINAQQVPSMDYFDMGVMMIFSGLIMIISIVQAVTMLYPTLVLIFGVPPIIAGVLQAMIYLSYVWGFAQWRSGRSGSMMQ